MMGTVARAEARHSISAAILLRFPLDGGVHLLACVWGLRDKVCVSINIVKMDFVVPVYDGAGDWTGELTPVNKVGGWWPAPRITLDEVGTDDVDLSADGRITVTIKGAVTDPLADIVAEGKADIDRVFIRLPASNDDGTDDIEVPLQKSSIAGTLVRPYPFEGRFSQEVSFRAAEGVNAIHLRSAPNAVGLVSDASLAIEVQTTTTYGSYNGGSRVAVLLDASSNDGFDPGVAETLSLGSAFAEAFQLTETQEDSLVFHGARSVLDSVFNASVSILQEPELLLGRRDFILATIDDELIDLEGQQCVLLETEANSGAFVAGSPEYGATGEFETSPLNVVLPSAFEQGVADSLVAYVGVREPGADDGQLLEDPIDSMIFSGYIAGLGNCSVSLACHSSLQEDAEDQIGIYFTCTEIGVDSEAMVLGETGGNTLLFRTFSSGIGPSGSVNYVLGDIEHSHSRWNGFLPFLVRVRTPAGLDLPQSVSFNDIPFGLAEGPDGDKYFDEVFAVVVPELLADASNVFCMPQELRAEFMGVQLVDPPYAVHSMTVSSARSIDIRNPIHEGRRVDPTSLSSCWIGSMNVDTLGNPYSMVHEVLLDDASEAQISVSAGFSGDFDGMVPVHASDPGAVSEEDMYITLRGPWPSEDAETKQGDNATFDLTAPGKYILFAWVDSDKDAVMDLGRPWQDSPSGHQDVVWRAMIVDVYCPGTVILFDGYGPDDDIGTPLAPNWRKLLDENVAKSTTGKKINEYNFGLPGYWFKNEASGDAYFCATRQYALVRVLVDASKKQVFLNALGGSNRNGRYPGEPYSPFVVFDGHARSGWWWAGYSWRFNDGSELVKNDIVPGNWTYKLLLACSCFAYERPGDWFREATKQGKEIVTDKGHLYGAKGIWTVKVFLEWLFEQPLPTYDEKGLVDTLKEFYKTAPPYKGYPMYGWRLNE